MTTSDSPTSTSMSTQQDDQRLQEIRDKMASLTPNELIGFYLRVEELENENDRLRHELGEHIEAARRALDWQGEAARLREENERLRSIIRELEARFPTTAA